MKLKKYLCFLLIVLICAFSLNAQSTKESVSSSDLRIVSLAPGMTELVYALDCGDCLVGRTDYCDYPAECLNVPSIGDSWMPNVELIVSKQPTVVLVSSLTDPNYITKMENAGLNVQRIVFEESLEGTYEMIKQVGKAIGKEKEALKLAKDSENRIENIKKITSKAKTKKSCLYVIGWGEFGDWVATGDTFINGIINACNAENAAKDSFGWSISQEAIINANPDIIILPDYSYATADITGYKSTFPYNQLSGEVLSINGDAMERQGLRTADSVEMLAKLIYPELFK